MPSLTQGKTRSRRGKYRRYPFSLKKEAVDLSIKLGDPVQASKIMDVPLKNLRRWVENGPKRKKGGRKTHDPEMETKLYSWMLEFREVYEHLPARKKIKEKAMQYSRFPHKFKASKGWYEKFMLRRFPDHSKKVKKQSLKIENSDKTVKNEIEETKKEEIFEENEEQNPKKYNLKIENRDSNPESKGKEDSPLKNEISRNLDKMFALGGGKRTFSQLGNESPNLKREQDSGMKLEEFEGPALQLPKPGRKRLKTEPYNRIADFWNQYVSKSDGTSGEEFLVNLKSILKNVSQKNSSISDSKFAALSSDQTNSFMDLKIEVPFPEELRPFLQNKSTNLFGITRNFKIPSLNEDIQLPNLSRPLTRGFGMGMDMDIQPPPNNSPKPKEFIIEEDQNTEQKNESNKVSCSDKRMVMASSQHRRFKDLNILEQIINEPQSIRPTPSDEHQENKLGVSSISRLLRPPEKSYGDRRSLISEVPLKINNLIDFSQVTQQININPSLSQVPVLRDLQKWKIAGEYQRRNLIKDICFDSANAKKEIL